MKRSMPIVAVAVLVAACEAPKPAQPEATEAAQPEATEAAQPEATETAQPEATEAEAVAAEGAVEAPTVEAPTVEYAVAVLEPKSDSGVTGTVRFALGADGVSVDANAAGLTPGLHAFHVHVYGDCTSPDGKSAGTHYNFQGGPGNDPSIKRITGNLGELDADEEGNASLTENVPEAELNGPDSIIGRAVIVHEKPNDPSDPPIGAAGGRVACGVIGIAAPPAE